MDIKKRGDLLGSFSAEPKKRDLLGHFSAAIKKKHDLLASLSGSKAKDKNQREYSAITTSDCVVLAMD